MSWFKSDKQMWTEIIRTVSNETNKTFLMIEKDTLQSMFLYALSNSHVPFVFKGGTSLSKAYNLINRFSEDIDLSLQENPTESIKRKANASIIEAANFLDMKLINKDKIQSRFSYNKYLFEYDSLFNSKKSEIIVETNFFTSAKPVEKMQIMSVVGKYINKANISLPIEFVAENFHMDVQSIERTLIDKVFALCDYRIENMADRDSRHLYDIAKILECFDIANINKELISNVRDERAKSKNNPSANSAYNISHMLKEIIDSKFFMTDYNNLTIKLLYEEYPYELAIENGISKIAESCVFS